MDFAVLLRKICIKGVMIWIVCHFSVTKSSLGNIFFSYSHATLIPYSAVPLLPQISESSLSVLFESPFTQISRLHGPFRFRPGTARLSLVSHCVDRLVFLSSNTTWPFTVEQNFTEDCR